MSPPAPRRQPQKGTTVTIEELIASRRAAADALVAQRAALGAEAQAILDQVEAEGRTQLTEEEDTRHLDIVGQRASLQAQIDAAGRVIASLEDEKRQNDADALDARTHNPVAPAPAARIGSEPETYRNGGQASYFRDLYMARTYGKPDAIERLRRNDSEVRAISGTDGAGGEFVPPTWLVDQFAAKARPGRVFANQVEQLPLPAGTDSISLPLITTGTSVAEQTTQNSDASETDMVTSSATAAVATLGGRQTVSLQLVEQSPINIDQIVLGDLAADYAKALDVFALSNNATNKKGVLQVSGVNTVTYTSATPKVSELVPKVIAAATAVGANRFLPAEKVFMRPEAWGWIVSAQDSDGRPLIGFVDFGPSNAQGAAEGAFAEGLAGYITSLHLPVYIDANMPNNAGTGTNESPILVARTSDIQLYEGTLKAESFRETKAEQLSVVFRLYNYVALQSARSPKSISVVSGTGTVTPTA